MSRVGEIIREGYINTVVAAGAAFEWNYTTGEAARLRDRDQGFGIHKIGKFIGDEEQAFAGLLRALLRQGPIGEVATQNNLANLAILTGAAAICLARSNH